MTCRSNTYKGQKRIYTSTIVDSCLCCHLNINIWAKHFSSLEVYYHFLIKLYHKFQKLMV